MNYYNNGVLTQMTPEEVSEYEASLPTQEELLQQAKDTKCKLVDSATANSIITLAGDLKQQANKQAKSSQLIRKESLGTITDEEKITLDYLDGLFVQIETLIADGNAKELEIQACTTLEELDVLQLY